MPPDPDSAREDRVNAAIAAYLQAAESGQTPDREVFLHAHADLADELAEFIDDREHFSQLASRLVPEAPAPHSDFRDGDSSPEDLPRQVGDYQLVEEIARGGMGIVYRANQISLHRTVAVKMILAGRLASAESVARFRSEAGAAARLDHPNIVPIYEVGEQDGQPYFSMRMVEGGDLTHYRARYRNDPRAAAELVASLADAVHHAHQRGILHRDLKPRNILLDSEGKPQITDFGLAKLLEADGSLTQSGAVLGTAAYMAPEQARGDNSLTTAVDVYSLGAILYELLTGTPPFRAATPAETIVEVLEKEPSSPRSVDTKIDRDLSTICLKCLEKQPAARYRSAEALALDLRRWLKGLPIEARPVGTFERICRGCRRNPALTAVITVAVAIIVCMTGLYIGSLNEALERARMAGDQARWSEEETRDALARSRFEQARALSIAGPPGRRWTILELVAEVETLRTRNRSAQGTLSHGSERQPVLPRQDELRSEAVTALLLADARVRWQASLESFGQPGLTADSRQAIAYLVKSNVVSVTDLQSGRVLASWSNPALLGATAFGLAPSAKTAAAFDATKPGLVLIDASTGRVLRELVWPEHERPDGSGGRPRFVWSSEIVFSPDGRYLAVVGRRPTDQTLMLWCLDRPDEPRVLATMPENTDLGPPIFLPDGSKLAYATGRDVISVWDVTRPDGASEIRLPVTLAGQFAVDSSGQRLALAGANADPNKGTLVIWNLVDRRETAQITTDFPLKAAPLAFHPKRNSLAAGTTDGRLFVVDLLRQQTSLAIPGAHSSRLVHLRWSPDGNDLISWGLDLPNSRQDRGILACREFGSTPTDEIPVDSIAAPFGASPDGNWLATVHENGQRIRLLDRQAAEAAREFADTGLPAVTHLEFSPGGDRLVAADDYSVVIWNLAEASEVARLDRAAGLRGLLTSVAFTANGACLAAENIGNDTVAVWNVEEKRIVHSFQAGPVQSALFCPGADRLAILGNESDRMVLCQSLTGQRLAERELPGEPVRPSAFSPDGNWMVVHVGAESDPLDAIAERQLGLPPAAPNVMVEPLTDGRPSQTITGPSDFNERACAFSPDGRLLALGYRDGSITLWDLPAGEEVFHVRYRQLPITQLAFASQGRHLLVGDGGRTIGMIDLAKLRETLTTLNLAW